MGLGSGTFAWSWLGAGSPFTVSMAAGLGVGGLVGVWVKAGWVPRPWSFTQGVSE